MSGMVHALAVLCVAFAVVVASARADDELADRFTRHSLRLQQEYAESVKGFDVHKVYVFDSSSFFHGADTVIRNDVRVKIRGGKYAVLSEAAQAVLDAESYKHFSCDVQLKQDEIGYYV